MSRKVLLVDYGVGNLLSVSRALEACGGEVTLSDSPKAVAEAERIVLPGVGAFGDCWDELKRRKLIDPLLAYSKSGRPILGICVGMQIMLEYGEEFGEHKSFGLVRGRVKAIPRTTADGKPHKIPHIGWNNLRKPVGQDWRDTVLEDIEPGEACYFVHSFTAVCEDPENCLATADYHGRTVTAAVRVGSVFGVQFHPEKSGRVGLRIVTRFLNMG
jgi:glutamine amidotransferase